MKDYSLNEYEESVKELLHYWEKQLEGAEAEKNYAPQQVEHYKATLRNINLFKTKKGR